MRKRCLVCIAVLFAAAGCVRYAIVPPAVDLTALKTLGLIDFRAENTKGDLYVMATQYFLQEVSAAQRVPVLELRLLEGVLDEIGKPALDRDAALAIGEKFGVDAFFVGEIQVTKVKPRIDLVAPLSKTLFARATFDMSVTARLISTANGATLWTASVVRQGTVGAVGMEDAVPVFRVRDKDTALEDTLREIMFRLTWDFRPTRRRL
jgi:hypothetical protein